MSIAELIGSASYANKKKVGAILVKNGRIISTGYNGTPSGFDNQCEIDGITKKEVLHAESNAITKCAKSNESTQGSTMYITLSPCFECSKLIIQSGINKVYYKEQYRDTDGIKLLKKAGIEIYEFTL
jgi:dCMP deaminase